MYVCTYWFNSFFWNKLQIYREAAKIEQKVLVPPCSFTVT